MSYLRVTNPVQRRREAGRAEISGEVASVCGAASVTCGGSIPVLHQLAQVNEINQVNFELNLTQACLFS